MGGSVAGGAWLQALRLPGAVWKPGLSWWRTVRDLLEIRVVIQPSLEIFGRHRPDIGHTALASRAGEQGNFLAASKIHASGAVAGRAVTSRQVTTTVCVDGST